MDGTTNATKVTEYVVVSHGGMSHLAGMTFRLPKSLTSPGVTVSRP